MLIPALPSHTCCRFRAMKIGDGQRILEINNDRETRLYTSLLRQQTLEDIQSWLQYYPHYQRHGFGSWAIEDTDSKLLAGLCGLRVRKDLGGQIDISYRMHPDFRGKGIATSAVKTCVDWGFEALNLNQILAQVHTENTISMHILTKTGFTPVGTDGVWTDLTISNPLKG